MERLAQQEGPWFKSSLKPFNVEFTCSPISLWVGTLASCHSSETRMGLADYRCEWLSVFPAKDW